MASMRCPCAAQTGLKSLLKQLKAASSREGVEAARATTSTLRAIFELLSTPVLNGLAVDFTRFIDEHAVEWRRIIGELPPSSSGIFPQRQTEIAPDRPPIRELCDDADSSARLISQSRDGHTQSGGGRRTLPSSFDGKRGQVEEIEMKRQKVF